MTCFFLLELFLSIYDLDLDYVDTFAFFNRAQARIYCSKATPAGRVISA